MWYRAQDDRFIHYRSANVSNDTDSFFFFVFSVLCYGAMLLGLIRPVIYSMCFPVSQACSRICVPSVRLLQDGGAEQA